MLYRPTEMTATNILIGFLLLHFLNHLVSSISAHKRRRTRTREPLSQCVERMP